MTLIAFDFAGCYIYWPIAQTFAKQIIDIFAAPAAWLVPIFGNRSSILVQIITPSLSYAYTHRERERASNDSGYNFGVKIHQRA